MMWFIGFLFTAGFLMVTEEDAPDTWKYAAKFMFHCVAFPLFWGMVLGDWLKKHSKD